MNTHSPTEQWRDVPDYEGLYQVSDQGRVLKCQTGRIFKAEPKVSRYPLVQLEKDGVRKGHRVHRLVARAFLGECPQNMVVNHIDGNRQNNRVDNLEYCTQVENSHHASFIGLRGKGGVPSIHVVLEIRERYSRGDITQTALGADYGLSQRTVSHIVNNRSWNTPASPSPESEVAR